MSLKKIAAFLSFIFFLTFAEFTRVVRWGALKQWDFDTTVRLQDKIPHIFDFPFSILSILGSAEVTILIWLVILIITLRKRLWLTTFSLLLFLGGLLVEVIGKTFVFHPAPPHLFYRGVINFNLPSSFVQTNYSYPSGHLTRTTFLVIFLLGWITFRNSGIKRIIGQTFLVLLLFAMAVSRIYLGEHWSTDVIGGFLLGGALGLISVITIPKKAEKSP